MSDAAPPPRYRFGVFEADASTGELRKQGIRVKLNAQPFQVLLMLLDRPGEVLTREEISQTLWSDGTFVDYEHGLNSAVNRIREVLGDSATSPRFVETLARRGYRFVASVQRIAPDAVPQTSKQTLQPAGGDGDFVNPKNKAATGSFPRPQNCPKLLHNVVRALFLILQLMYLGFYVGALANLAEIEDLLSPLRAATAIFYLLIGTASVLIAVRAYLISAIALRATGMRGKVPDDVALSAHCRCALGALAAAAAAPHQHRPGARVHGASRLLALCAAIVDSDGRSPQEGAASEESQ